MTTRAQCSQPRTHVLPALPVDAVQAALQKTEQRDSNPSNGCGCGLLEDDTRHLESREDDGIRLFTEGDTLYAAMLASIRGARHAVRMESYIFASDEIGWQFAEALAERAAAGIDVRLHLDAAGAWHSSSLALQRHLRDRGVRVRWFHRWHWRQPLRYNRRNHRKLLVVDEHTAYVGGCWSHRKATCRSRAGRRTRSMVR